MSMCKTWIDSWCSSYSCGVSSQSRRGCWRESISKRCLLRLEQCPKSCASFLAIGLNRKRAGTWKPLDLSPFLFCSSWFSVLWTLFCHLPPAFCINAFWWGNSSVQKAHTTWWLFLTIFLGRQLFFPFFYCSCRDKVNCNSLRVPLKPKKQSENNLIGFLEVWSQPKRCPSGRN